MNLSATTQLAGRPTQELTQPGRISIGNFLLVLAQLGLVLVLMRQFQIESAAFLRLATLAFAGFAIHAWLPMRLRQPFFLALSLAGIVWVLGVANAAWLIGIGLLLIAICHLPLPIRWRGMLLLGATIVLALQRAGVMPFPWSEAIWPILGAMFMFRMILYFYELSHGPTHASPSQALSYFFMLPGACFPLFPVIDYKTFLRNYFDDDAYRIYQQGIEWMVRGIVQLILYRVVYYHLTLAPYEVVTPDTLVQFLAANFLLYLRVSGLFHLIVGMLYLFGFRLPETHNRYLLAASFTDFWRRINIYWKDFMQKVFYYPAVFKLKAMGTEKALVIATLFVFIMTWFLHAYQWFWLRGSTLFVAQDILFWTILGVLVVVNSLWEIRHGRKRRLGTPKRTWGDIARQVLKSYATFWFICVLWSFWTTESLSAWFALWNALGGELSARILIFPAIILAVIVLGTIPSDSVRNLRGTAQDAGMWSRSLLGTVAALVALIGISVEGIHTRIGDDVGTFVHSLRSGQLSRLDMAKMERGYYENLLDVDRFNSQLWEVYSQKPKQWLDVDNANLKHFVGGFHQVELIPSFVQNTKYGTISINDLGMRDQQYEVKPAPGTFRVAVLGASSVMGWGVGDGETFEALVEQRLNKEWAVGPYAHYELLNMGVPGYDPPQQMAAAEKAFTYAPNALYYIATGRERLRAARYLVDVVLKGIEIPHDELRRVVQQAGVHAQMDEAEAVKLMTPYGDQIIAYVYRQIAGESRRRGIVPVWIFLPQSPEGDWQTVTDKTRESAREAGFEMLDLTGVFEGHEPETVNLAAWDAHPNVLGHQLIAERLFADLSARRADLFPAQ